MASYNPNYFRKGLLPLLLLQLLQEKDMYGYELVKTIAARTNGTIIVKEGALYPILYQLLDDKQISDRKVPYKRRMTHVYYHLEEPGRKLLQELRQEYLNVTGAMMKFLESGEENHE